MIDDRELFERAVERFAPPERSFERLVERRDRKHRNRRIRAGVVALVVTAIGTGALLQAFPTGLMPADDPRSPFLGSWVTTDGDGSSQTMTIRAPGDDALEIVVHDDAASVCSGGPSTMTGAGQLEGGTQLVIPAPVYTCDDGSEPEPLSGPLLLRDLTFVLDPEADALTDNFGGVWLWQGVEDRSTTEDPFEDLEPLWPQTSLEEVRQAQELADDGDPRYAWQVSRNRWYQPGQNHPIGGNFFARFLEEELGWEEFLWDEAFAHPRGLDSGDVVYVRCAPGLQNPLYPTGAYPSDARRPGCAPTIDELRYETVKIHVAQLDRQGSGGIWVVTDWEMIEPAAQIAPPTDAEIAASLEAFLKARIDGEGAQAFADLGYDPYSDQRVEQKIPLLYATSAGAPYERSEFKVVDGPVWPSGRMQFEVRLFAENDETVVDQVFSLDRDGQGRLRVVYDFQPSGPGGPVPATTENGKAVPMEYGLLDGEVTLRAAGPWEPYEGGQDWAAITGAHFNRLLILADPRPIGPNCAVAPAPADAEALARSIGSDPDLEAEAPVAATIGGIPALQIDVALAPGAGRCAFKLEEAGGSVSGTTPLLLKDAPLDVYGWRQARLYLLDLPGGSARVVAIAIISSEDGFERALASAAPIVDSFEFHAR
jgi:hypothetical protein